MPASAKRPSPARRTMNPRSINMKKILFSSLLSLAIIVVASLLLFPMLKMALHLNFSQEYRQVDVADGIRCIGRSKYF